MMKTFVFALFVAAALAQTTSTTVIATDDQVAATFTAKASADIRNMVIIGPILNSVIAYGLHVQVSGNTGTADMVYITSNNAPFPSVDWSYFASSQTQTPGGLDRSLSGLSTAFRSLAVVAYNDANGNNKFDFGEGASIDVLSRGAYTTTKKEVAVNGGGTAQIITTQRSDQSFGYRYSLQSRAIANQGTQIGSDALKIDIWITPKSLPAATTGNRIALVASYSTLQIDATGSGSGTYSNNNLTLNAGARIQFSRNGQGSTLQWAGTARAGYSDGTSGSVGVTADVYNTASLTIAGQTVSDSFSLGRLLVFSFNANSPSQIYWDPSFGSTGSVGNSATLVSVSLAFVVALVALLL